MSDQFLAEIRIFPFNFAPVGWAMCQGQTLSISQYAALFSLLGTTYGGNGTSNFQLPNLQGRVPLDFGNGAGLSPYVLGELGGSESVTVLSTQMGQHTHVVQATSASGRRVNSPTNAYFCDTSTATYVAASSNPPLVAMDPRVISAGTGGNQPHENRQPFLVLNFCIALSGVYPTRG